MKVASEKPQQFKAKGVITWHLINVTKEKLLKY